MKATIVQLRYKMKDILKALDRQEKVSIFYHGKIKGTIVPKSENNHTHVKEHPFFGMYKNADINVDKAVDGLRGPRYSDI